jgi:hypothetical protein
MFAVLVTTPPNAELNAVCIKQVVDSAGEGTKFENGSVGWLDSRLHPPAKQHAYTLRYVCSPAQSQSAWRASAIVMAGRDKKVVDGFLRLVAAYLI